MGSPQRTCELASNDGWAVLQVGIAREIDGTPHRVHLGSLRLTRSYWDREELLGGTYGPRRADFGLAFEQVPFETRVLEALSSGLLAWTEQPLAALTIATFEHEAPLCRMRDLELTLRLGAVPGYRRGDRTLCVLHHRTGALDDVEEGESRFVIDVSGARAFALDLRAMLGSVH